jgi:hypothetical protein
MTELTQEQRNNINKALSSGDLTDFKTNMGISYWRNLPDSDCYHLAWNYPLPIGSMVQEPREYYLWEKLREDGCCSEWINQKGEVMMISDRKIYGFYCFSHLNCPIQIKIRES